MTGSTKEEIVRDLVRRGTDRWGAERTEALQAKIEQTAGWLSLIGEASFALDEDEPDFLVAPAPETSEEGRV